MKTVLMKKSREGADEELELPRRKDRSPPYRGGGISAVAIATPGMTVELRSLRDCATIPASPPKKAISTS